MEVISRAARQNSTLPQECGVPKAGRNAAFMRQNWVFEEICPAPYFAAQLLLGLSP
jgi:hypothetical protein